MQIRRRRRLLTNAHLLAIGKVVTEWAMVEDLLGITVGALLCGNASHVDRYILLSQMDYRHRRDALLAYCELLSLGTAKDELTEIMREVERLVKIRDIAAHGTWVAGRKRGSIKPLSFRARGGSVKLRGHLDNEPNHTGASLTANADEIARLYVRLTRFLRGTGRNVFLAAAPQVANKRSTRSRTSASKGEKPSQRS
jgi:hypothetical protein